MRLQQHLNRFLLGYALAAVATGLALGYPAPAWTKLHSSALSDLTTVGVFLIIFAKEQLIAARWHTVLLLLVANALFIALTLLVATWLDRRAGLDYREHMAVVFASTGKNNATAIAIAAIAFSPLVAVPAATMPIFQIILLVGYPKAADRVCRYYHCRSRVPLAGPTRVPAHG